jgi:hypothetical protein
MVVLVAAVCMVVLVAAKVEAGWLLVVVEAWCGGGLV